MIVSDSMFIHPEGPVAINRAQWHPNQKIKRIDKTGNVLFIRGLENESGIFVRKMAIPKDENRFMRWTRSFSWVRVNDGSGTFYLKVKDLQKYLLFSPKEI